MGADQEWQLAAEEQERVDAAAAAAAAATAAGMTASRSTPSWIICCLALGCATASHGSGSTTVITANCIIIDHFSAFESGLVAPFLYAA